VSSFTSFCLSFPGAGNGLAGLSRRPDSSARMEYPGTCHFLLQAPMTAVTKQTRKISEERFFLRSGRGETVRRLVPRPQLPLLSRLTKHIDRRQGARQENGRLLADLIEFPQQLRQSDGDGLGKLARLHGA